MNLIKLKKCPFCGGDARLYVNYDGVVAECKKCHCRTQTFSDAKHKFDNSTAIERTIEIWNTRCDNGTNDNI